MLSMCAPVVILVDCGDMVLAQLRGQWVLLRENSDDEY